MADDDYEIDLAAFDHVVMQVFEEQEDRSGVLTYPLTSQRQALDFVKLMNRKGFPYQQMCDDIGEKPETFRSWRLGNGNSHVGQMMMRRINKTIQEAMNMADGDAEQDQDDLEADGFLDDIDSDGQEDPSSLVDSADDKKCSSLPNGELGQSLVNDDVILPLENDINVDKPEIETNCDTTIKVPTSEVIDVVTEISDGTKTDNVTETSDVTGISDAVKTGDVATASDSTKGSTSVSNEALPEDTSVSSCQASEKGDEDKVDGVIAGVETLEAKDTQCKSSIEKDEVKSVVLNKNDADAVDATKIIETSAIASHKSELNSRTPSAIKLANPPVETVMNVNEKLTKKEATEVESSSFSDRTSSCEAVDPVQVTGEQSTADVQQIHADILKGVTETRTSDKAEELVSDVTTKSQPVELEAVQKDGPESLPVVEAVNGVSTELLPGTANKSSVFKEETNQPTNSTTEQAVVEKAPVEEPPKVEYEASTKQLSLLNRLAMLKEKAGQRKSTTDGESPDGSSGTTSSLPVSPTSDVTLSLTAATKEATVQPVTIEKANTSSLIAQPVGKLSSTSVADAALLQKCVADVADSKAQLKTKCKEVEKSSLPSSGKNVDTAHKSDITSETLPTEGTRGVGSSVKINPLVSTKAVAEPLKITEEISSKAVNKAEMNLTTAATPGTTSKSLGVTEVDKACKIAQESSTKPLNNKPTELSQPITVTPGIISDEIKKTEEKQRTTETKSLKPSDNDVKIIESKAAVKSDDSIAKSSSSVKAGENIVSTCKNMHQGTDAVDSNILAKQVVKIGEKQIIERDVQSQATTNKPETLKGSSDKKLSKEVGLNVDTKTETNVTSTEQQIKSKSQPAVTEKQTIETDSQKSMSSTDVAKQQDPHKGHEEKQVTNQQVSELVTPPGHQLGPERNQLGQRVRTAGRRLDAVFSSIYDGSVTANYDSDLDIAGTNEKTYTLVDRVRRLKASPVETPGYLYVFTDCPTEEGTSDKKVTGTLPRFQVGASRFPGKRLQQATCFNPEMKPFIVASVNRRLEALRLAREKLEQFHVTGTSDWFACDDDVIASVIDTVVNEMKT